MPTRIKGFQSPISWGYTLIPPSDWILSMDHCILDPPSVMKSGKGSKP